jgi:hypothetical protein
VEDIDGIRGQVTMLQGREKRLDEYLEEVQRLLQEQVRRVFVLSAPFSLT